MFATHSSWSSWNLGKNKFVMRAFVSVEYCAMRFCRTLTSWIFTVCPGESKSAWQIHFIEIQLKFDYKDRIILQDYLYPLLSFVVLNTRLTGNNPLLFALLTCAPWCTSFLVFWQLCLENFQIWILKPKLMLVHKMSHFNCKMWVRLHSDRFLWH